MFSYCLFQPFVERKGQTQRCSVSQKSATAKDHPTLTGDKKAMQKLLDNLWWSCTLPLECFHGCGVEGWSCCCKRRSYIPSNHFHIRLLIDPRMQREESLEIQVGKAICRYNLKNSLKQVVAKNSATNICRSRSVGVSTWSLEHGESHICRSTMWFCNSILGV